MAGSSFLMGMIIAGMISSADSHTGVGMGGFARMLLGGIAGGALVVLGLVLAIFRKTRRFGLLMSAAGAGFFLGLFLTLVLSVLA